MHLPGVEAVVGNSTFEQIMEQYIFIGYEVKNKCLKELICVMANFTDYFKSYT